MKLTYQQAIAEVKRRIAPHRAVKTHYWSMDCWEWVECWTVVRKTKLDLLLDTVKPREHELTIDVSELDPPSVARIVSTAVDRGLDVAGDNRYLLIRDLR